MTALSSKRTAVLAALFVAILAVSSASAVHTWSSYGVSVDLGLSTAIAVMCLVSIYVLIKNIRIVRLDRESAEDDVVLVMVRGPSENGPRTGPVKGKMPNQKVL